jgi:Delta7-sterol 5-desaturase
MPHLIGAPDLGSATWREIVEFLANVWFGDVVTDLVLYLAAAGLSFVLLWIVFRRRFEGRRIDPRYPAASEMRREFLYSLSTLAIFGAMGTLTVVATLFGWTKLSFEVPALGWGWFCLSLPLLFVAHDTYFYWAHRAMHHPALFRVFHRTHHRSVNPSPWAAYAFAPAEAVVEAAFLPLFVLVVPIDVLAVLIFIAAQVARNALGHSGYEIFPPAWQRLPVLRWLNTNTHHHLHHETGRGNYGLYFLWWDRLMGTEHADTATVFARAASGGKAADPARDPLLRRAAVAPAGSD